MTRRTRWRQGVAVAACCALAIPALGACGNDPTPPAESVPALGARLDRVDAAIADRDYSAARSDLRALVSITAQAQVSETITDDQASQIIDAARTLLRRLPGPGSGSLETPSESPSAPLTRLPVPVEPENEGKTDEEKSDEQDKEGKEGKDGKEDDESDKDIGKSGGGEGEGEGDGGGNGPSSGNGPDDGHGN